VLLHLNGCDSDDCPDVSNPECENYDPCFGRDNEPEVLDFSIGNILGLTNIVVTGDTMIDEWRVVFTAQFMAEEYEWEIGNEVTSRFGESVAANVEGFSGDINVRLVARQICQRAVVREDTIEKVFHLVDVGGLSLPSTILPVHGEFRGNIVGRVEDDFTISMTPAPDANQRGINHFPPQCGDRLSTSLLPLRYIPAWKHIYVTGNRFSPQPFCYPAGLGELSENNDTLKIQYFYFEQDDDENFINRNETLWNTFIGVRN